MNLQIIKLLLENKASVNSVDFEFKKFTPLHYAIASRQPENVKFMIDNGADLFILSENAQSALHMVCIFIPTPAMFSIVRILVSSICGDENRRKYLNLESSNKDTALHLISCLPSNESKYQIVKYLVEHKSDINCVNSFKFSVLMTFVNINTYIDYKMIKFLIDSGADLKDHANKVCLHKLCRNPSISIDLIKLFVENSAYVGRYLCWSPIECLCANNSSSEEMIEYLMENKAELNVIAIKNYTHKSNFNFSFFSKMLEQKIDINTADIVKSSDTCKVGRENSVLNLLCLNQYLTTESFISMIVKHNADFFQTNNHSKWSAMHSLFKTQKQSLLIDYILPKFKNRLDSIKNSNRETPLHLLFRNENIDHSLLENLISKNAENNETINLYLLNISKRHHPSKHLFELLLENKADLNISINNRKSVIHNICTSKELNRDLLIWLLENKADPTIVDKKEKTALHYLCQNDNVQFECVKLLVEHSDCLGEYDQNNYTPFDFALTNSCFNLEHIRYMISKHKPDLGDGETFCISNKLSSEINEISHLDCFGFLKEEIKKYHG